MRVRARVLVLLASLGAVAPARAHDDPGPSAPGGPAAPPAPAPAPVAPPAPPAPAAPAPDAPPPPPPPASTPDRPVVYLGPDAVARRCRAIAARPAWGARTAEVVVYGTSAGGRPLEAVRFGPKDAPVVLVHGGLADNDAAGTAAALDLCERLLPEAGARRAADPPDVRVGYLVIPAPNPDALAAFLGGQGWGRGGGDVDRDRDGRRGEDGPDDLDGDGEILWMRRREVGGRFAPDDAPPRADGMRMGDPRLVRDAGPDARRAVSFGPIEREGRDDDGDGAVNEDPPGTDLTRNLMGVWEEMGAWPGDGPFPGSAPEASALMDLSFETRGLLAWYGFTSEGPRLERASERGADADADDALYARLVPAWKAACGLETRKASERPGASANVGSDLDWAARHLGVPACRVPVWRIPTEGANGRSRADADELDWLLWNDRVLGGKGFAPWREVKHPTYGTVEIGGWRRFTRHEPPADALAAAVHGVAGVPLAHGAFAPRLAVSVEAKDLGAGITRVRARVQNVGDAPTENARAERAARAQGVQVQLALGSGSERLAGPERTSVGTLAAGAVSEETEWLVRRTAPGAIGRVVARHRVAGTAETEVKLP